MRARVNTEFRFNLGVTNENAEERLGSNDKTNNSTTTPDPSTDHEKAKKRKKSVVVLYNHIGEDPYEKLRHVDPQRLEFQPEYPIHVSTVTEEYEDIVRALRSAGYRARAVNLENSLKKLQRILGRSRPDVVFNLVEFFHDDAELETAVAGVFDLYQIPYTGASPFALGLCLRKGLTKRVLQDHGVPTPKFKILYEPELPKRLGLHYPVIVKPAWADASAGVNKDSVIRDPRDPQLLAEQVKHVYDEYGAVLIEEFIEGRELHVSVWGNDDPKCLPPVEFDFSKLPPEYPPIISYAMKWNPLDEVYHRVDTLCPAPLDKRVLRKIQTVAIRAYEATECRDYARLDIRLKDNKPYVLEVNPNPDLTEGVSFMDSAEQAGYTFAQALARIAELALERKPEPAQPATPVADASSADADLAPRLSQEYEDPIISSLRELGDAPVRTESAASDNDDTDIAKVSGDAGTDVDRSGS
jgi:D-alanine-D-alanine ligase